MCLMIFFNYVHFCPHPFRRANTEGKFSNMLQALGLSLVEFQAPLFSCLAISPILLFRTCQLQSSRVGRHLYLSVCLLFLQRPSTLFMNLPQFLMSLGDIKPASLRETETLIWKDLYLVARCQLSAEEMFNHVLDHIVPSQDLESFRLDKHRLHRYFKAKYDPIRDHTSFFLLGEFNNA